MNELIYIAIGTLGAILGSFASAVIPRIKEKQDFVRARSECPACHHELGTLDLFPILSYIFLLGKCRYCKAKIPPYHFLLELSMTGGFLLVATQLVDVSAIAAFDMAEICTLIFLLISMFVTIVFSAYDLLYWEIPDEFMIPFLIVTFFLLAWAQFLPKDTFEYFIPFQNSFLNIPLHQAMLGALPIFLFFLFQFVISNGTWLGWWDLRIALFMGFVAGAKIAWLGLFLSYIVGSIVGVVLIILQRKKGMMIPFWPFLAIWLWAALLWHEPILNWYSNLLIT